MGEEMTAFGEEMKELIKKGVEEAFEKAMDAMRKSLADWVRESQIGAEKKMGWNYAGTSKLAAENDEGGREIEVGGEGTQAREMPKLLPEMPALQVFDENSERIFVQKAPTSISQETIGPEQITEVVSWWTGIPAKETSSNLVNPASTTRRDLVNPFIGGPKQGGVNIIEFTHTGTELKVVEPYQPAHQHIEMDGNGGSGSGGGPGNWRHKKLGIPNFVGIDPKKDRCRTKELRELLRESDYEDGSDDTNEPPQSLATKAISEQSLRPEVSFKSVVGMTLNSVVGLSNAKTMKMLDLIEDRQVVVMDDPGETHNFVSLSMVDVLSMLVEAWRMIRVKYRELEEDLRFLLFETSEGFDGGNWIHIHYLIEKQSFTLVQILAMFFAHLKQMSEKSLAIPKSESDCVIGVPSYFADLQRRAYLDVAEIAGLHSLKLMYDCTAIALGYGIRTEFPSKGPGNVVFVDIGHCDTQVTVAAFKPGHMKIVSHSFDRNLGGRNFHEVLFTHFATEFKEHYNIDVYSSTRASIRLRVACEQPKKVLSTIPEDKKRHIIYSLTKPLSDSILVNQENLSSRSALCFKALVHSDNWRFASKEMVNEVCQRVAGALDKLMQANSQIGLVKALAKSNSLAVETYARLFMHAGLRILTAGTVEGNSQKRLLALHMVNFLIKYLDPKSIFSELGLIIEEMGKCQLDKKAYSLDKYCIIANKNVHVFDPGGYEQNKKSFGIIDLNKERRQNKHRAGYYAGLIIQGDKLHFKGRIVIPKNSVYVPVLLRLYHDSLVGGHSGELKTYLRLAADWYLRRDVKNHMQLCSVCQQQKASQQLPAGLLQPLALPETSRVHPIFHVSQLKLHLGEAPVSPTIPSQLNAELEMMVEPAELLDVRQLQHQGSKEIEVLIQWKGLPQSEATWEDMDMIIQHFLAFHLEDKVNLWGRGIAMNQPGPLITYAR